MSGTLRRIGIGALSVVLALGMHAAPAFADAGQPTPTEIVAVDVPQTSTSSSLIASTKQSRTTPFEMVGVTWTSQTGPAPTVKVRTLGERWSEWVELAVEDGEEGLVKGTEPIFVGPSTAVEVNIFGQPTTTIDGIEAVLISPGDNPAGYDPNRISPAAASNQVAAPPIVTRSEWGANESWLAPECVKPKINKTIKAAVVHHTAGTNSYTPAEAPGIVRGIYAYHVKSRGWCDIGYNFLIDKFGTIYEGRHGGMTRPVHGAHAGKWNTNTVGVSIMMNSETAAATPEAMSAMARVLAWRLAPYGVDPLGKTYLVDGMYDTIVGHGSVMDTSCPGKDIKAKLPALRREVAAIMSPKDPRLATGLNLTTSRTVGDQDGDGMADLLVYDAEADAMSVMTSDGMFFGEPRVVSTGWSAYDWMSHVPDVTGDGRFDLLLRRKTGAMVLMPGRGNGRYGSPVLVGRGFAGMKDMVVLDDMNGDSRPDLIAIDATGTMRRWNIYGNRSLTDASVLSRPGAFRNSARLGTIGDFEGNPLPDLFAINNEGFLTAYFFNRGMIVSQRTLGRGWSPFVQLSSADVDGDGTLDMVGRASDGATYVYRKTRRTLASSLASKETAAYTMHA